MGEVKKIPPDVTKCTFLAFNKGVRTWRKRAPENMFSRLSRSHEHEVNKDAIDEHPFIELVEQHEAAIGRVCRSFCSVAEDREDLRQEILLNLWRGWKAYRPDHKASLGALANSTSNGRRAAVPRVSEHFWKKSFQHL